MSFVKLRFVVEMDASVFFEDGETIRAVVAKSKEEAKAILESGRFIYLLDDGGGGRSPVHVVGEPGVVIQSSVKSVHR